MKKKILSLITCSILIAIFSIPAFAASHCFYCGGSMKQTVHYTPWLTVGYQECKHGHFYAKDALIERTKVTTYVCSNCGKGYTTNQTLNDTKCLATKSTSSDTTDGEPCFNCSENSVTVKTHKTPWLTTATNENGVSTQERIVVKTSICGNCGQGGTTNETETRTICLHQYQ